MVSNRLDMVKPRKILRFIWLLSRLMDSHWKVPFSRSIGFNADSAFRSKMYVVIYHYRVGWGDRMLKSTTGMSD